MNNSRLVTISFHGTVAANSKKTLVSNKVDLPCTTKRIRAAFAEGCNRTLQLSIFISPDSSAPTAGPPTGANIFSELGHSSYIVGNDCIVDFLHETASKSAGVYLKVYANNTDDYEHTIDVQITVEVFPWEEKGE